jgi:HK97 gp10 family phage protein
VASKTITAQWKNREKVMAQLFAIAPEAEKRLAERQLVLAEDLAARIRAHAPRQTGRYQRSIRGDRLDARPGGRSAPVGMLSGSKDPNATGVFALFIWRWLEFGTVHMAARPHIFPIYRSRKPYIKRSLSSVLNRAVKRALKGA